MRLTARLEPDRAGRKLGTAARITEDQLRAAITRLLVHAKSEIQPETPVGATGNARGGWAVEEPRRRSGQLEGHLINPILYVEILERGRRPGRMPPPRALERWVGTKLGVPLAERPGVAFLIARKIGAQGYEGAHMVENGWRRAKRHARPELRKAGLRIVKELR